MSDELQQFVNFFANFFVSYVTYHQLVRILFFKSMIDPFVKVAPLHHTVASCKYMQLAITTKLNE